MTYWYVIKTKPKKETQVVKQLAKACYEVFFPSMRGVVALKPLFPSYIFIKTNFKTSHHYHMVRYTRGINHILGDEEGPQPIADVIVETLKEKMKDVFLVEQNLLFKEGDEVRVKKGILKDLIGMIEKNMTEEGRIKVLFKWINGSMRATLKYRELEKAA